MLATSTKPSLGLAAGLAVLCACASTPLAQSAPHAKAPNGQGPSTTPAATRPQLPASAPTTPALLLWHQSAPASAKLVAAVTQELGKGRSYQLRPLTAVFPLLRQKDRREKVRARAAAHREKARKAMLALDHATTESELEAARKLLEGSFVEVYAPTELAQVHLLRGMFALNRARPQQAREAFRAAIRLDPNLSPDAHYRPQVRAAFAQAKQTPIAVSEPRPELVARVLRVVTDARHGLVLTSSEQNGLVVLRALGFAPRTGTYVNVEALTVARADTTAVTRAQAFGAKLRAGLATRFPAPPKPPTTQRVPTPPPPPPPGKPWYKRWYVWAIAGAVVGAAAVTIPLVSSKDVVRADVSW